MQQVPQMYSSPCLVFTLPVVGDFPCNGTWNKESYVVKIGYVYVNIGGLLGPTHFSSTARNESHESWAWVSLVVAEFPSLAKQILSPRAKLHLQSPVTGRKRRIPPRGSRRLQMSEIREEDFKCNLTSIITMNTVESANRNYPHTLDLLFVCQYYSMKLPMSADCSDAWYQTLVKWRGLKPRLWKRRRA